VACIGPASRRHRACRSDTASTPPGSRRCSDQALMSLITGLPAPPCSRRHKPLLDFRNNGIQGAMAFLPNIVLSNWAPTTRSLQEELTTGPRYNDSSQTTRQWWIPLPIFPRTRKYGRAIPPRFSTAALVDSMVIHYEIPAEIKTVALDKGIPLIDLWTLMSNQKTCSRTASRECGGLPYDCAENYSML